MNLNQKFFRWFYLIGFFLITFLPLVNVPPLLFPADWAKAIIFKIIFSLLLFIFLFQLLYQNGFRASIKEKIKSLPLYFTVPFLSFAALAIIATIFSPEPAFSFWGSPYRGDGTLNLVLYLSLAIFSYLIVKKEDWGKIWISALTGGVVVCLIAIVQQFHLVSEKLLVAYSKRPPSTMGNPDFLAAYLIFLIFLSLYFFIKEKKIIVKITYSVLSSLFLFTTFLTMSRAAILAITIGFIWIVFFTNYKSTLIKKLKIVFAVFIIAVFSGIFFSANNPKSIPDFIQSNDIFSTFISRFKIDSIIGNSRIASWKIAIKAIQDKPILGWGPEDYSIAFDKYYSPSSGLSSSETGGWWDRAHNFIFEIAVTMGVPALLAFIIFWLALLFCLQKYKKIIPENNVIFSFLQAIIIALLINNFFSFDCAPTYIFSYLIVGYSLCLIYNKETEINRTENIDLTSGWKNFLIFALFILLIIFIWQYNIVPLQINKNINMADYYSKHGANSCDRSTSMLDKELNNHSFLDVYTGLRYISSVQNCIASGEKNDQEIINLINEATTVGEKAIKVRPLYVRTWIYLGFLENVLMSKTKDFSLRDKVDYYFETASKISPNRQEIYSEWAKTYLVTKDYKKAEEKINQCINLGPANGNCWWVLALSNLYQGNLLEAQKNIKKANENGRSTNDYVSLLQMTNAYVELISQNPNNIDYYKNLAPIYEKLIAFFPNNFQYHANVAFVYKELREYDKARKEAMTVLQLSPESKTSVEAFLQTLPY